MIYTVTFNPSVDYVMHTDSIRASCINRAQQEEIFFGGKGINVSLVLKELGIASKALGFTAGFTGRAIEEGVSQKGIETDFVRLDNGFSRINVKVIYDSENNIAELNGKGPEITNEALDEFFNKLKALKNGDVIVLAGSIPQSLPDDIYEKVLKELSDRNIRAVVDAEKELFLKSLKYKPFLVKPNRYELGEMFGVNLVTVEEIGQYAFKLKEMGAQNVLVSMSGDGALLVDENGKTHFCEACRGDVKNTVGSGDSMVAGFIAGLDKGYDYALRLGSAAGGATAFSGELAKKEEIYELLKQTDEK